nr:uncharacterized protein LOC127487573 [Oryctolagus cuniculus]
MGVPSAQGRRRWGLAALWQAEQQESPEAPRRKRRKRSRGGSALLWASGRSCRGGGRLLLELRPGRWPETRCCRTRGWPCFCKWWEPWKVNEGEHLPHPRLWARWLGDGRVVGEGERSPEEVQSQDQGGRGVEREAAVQAPPPPPTPPFPARLCPESREGLQAIGAPVRFSSLFFYFFIFFYLKGRVTERGRVGEIFYPLVHSPNGCNSQGWARLKPGIGNSTLGSHVRGRGPRTLAELHRLPRLFPSVSGNSRWAERSVGVTAESALCPPIPGWGRRERLEVPHVHAGLAAPSTHSIRGKHLALEHQRDLQDT